jgi:TRAP-type transport system small permease protein
MMSQSNSAGRTASLLRCLAWVSGLLLVGIMLLMTTDVFFRYILNQPIVGVQELVQLGIALVVMLAMPHCARQNSHIKVDVFDQVLGPRGRAFGDGLSRLVGACVLALLVYKASLKALDAWEYEDVTNMLELPVWPVYAAISLGMGLYVLVLLLELYEQLFSREADV